MDRVVEKATHESEVGVSIQTSMVYIFKKMCIDGFLNVVANKI